MAAVLYRSAPNDVLGPNFKRRKRARRPSRLRVEPQNRCLIAQRGIDHRRGDVPPDPHSNVLSAAEEA
jgi:hypothetical protein